MQKTKSCRSGIIQYTLSKKNYAFRDQKGENKSFELKNEIWAPKSVWYDWKFKKNGIEYRK
jgi:uncharacterized protein YdeI (BOF family)